MATVADTLDRAARKCSISSPGSWANATATEYVEIRDDFFVETMSNIRDRVDLPSPIGKQTTITGDGSESYSLPSDFSRLKRDPLAVYESTTLRRAGTPIASDGVWYHVNQVGGAGSYRYYRLEGYPGAYTIKFENDLTTGREVIVSYMSDLIVYDGSAYSSTFDADTDVLLLPPRLVEAGIVTRFRARRGMDPAPYSSIFEAELSRLTMDSGNIRTINFAGGSDEYKPMRVPVPDYIPQS